jgi:hypothetical protein
MSFSKVLKQSGIAHRFNFSVVTSNWVKALDKAELSGYSATPIRLGAKRVVISVDRRHSQRQLFLGLTCCITLIALGAGSIVFMEHDEPVVAEVKHCQDFSVGEFLTSKDNGFVIRDWIFETELLQTLGNLQQYSYVAHCQDQQSKGILTISRAAQSVQLKKLTPTEK